MYACWFNLFSCMFRDVSFVFSALFPCGSIDVHRAGVLVVGCLCCSSRAGVLLAGVIMPEFLCWKSVLELLCWSLRAGAFVLVLLRRTFCCVCVGVPCAGVFVPG